MPSVRPQEWERKDCAITPVGGARPLPKAGRQEPYLIRLGLSRFVQLRTICQTFAQQVDMARREPQA
jgi:hypothetical protein